MVPLDDDTYDFELIRCMAGRTADFEAARQAWGHFYVRHHRFLLGLCNASFGYVIGAETVKELVNDAFMKAYERANSFDHSEICEPCIQTRKCRGWLARILENLVRDLFRGHKEVPIVDVEDIERIGDNEGETLEVDPGPESQRLASVRAGFALLSDVEQTVLRATMAWWQPGTAHQRMPNAAMQQLSKQIGKSPENVRQIRLRATNKIKKYVNEKLVQ